MSILEEKSGGVDMAELERLRAENAALKVKLTDGKSKGEGFSVVVEHGEEVKEYTLSVKASEKGAVSIYGGGKFPVTVYPMLLKAILALGPELEAFMLREEAKLAWAKVKAS